MKRRFIVTHAILSTTISVLIFFSCSSKDGTITIDADPDFFITHYAGSGNGVNYFTYKLENITIYLKPNPLKNLYVTAKERYDGLDSLKIKKTKIKMGSNPVYSIEEIIKEK